MLRVLRWLFSRRQTPIIKVGPGSVIYHHGRCRETIIFEVDPSANFTVMGWGSHD